MSKFKFARALEAYVKNYSGKNVAIAPFTNTDSVSFDSIDGYVEIDAASIALSTSTVGVFSTWIRPVVAVPPLNLRILHFSDFTSGDYFDFYVDTNGRLKLDCRAGGVYQYRYQTNNTALFGNNAWRHICIIQDGVTGISVYVGGSLRTITAIAPTVDALAWFNSLTINTGRIGCYSSGGTNSLFYSGLQNNVSIFNTVKVIGDLWDGTGKPTDLTGESGLAAWWKMGTGDTYPNLIDNVSGNDGRMIDMISADIVSIVP